MTPIVLDDFVRESFDGVICDELPELDYLPESDAERDSTQGAAMAIIARELGQRFGRPLNASELAKLRVVIASEWGRRAERENERRGELRDGKLWANAETPFVDSY